MTAETPGASEITEAASGTGPPPSPSRRSTEGDVYTITADDWTELVEEGGEDERTLLNIGPIHPSSHGVLRMVMELSGEVVKECRLVIGYLHTGIEKNLEYRTWTQGVTFVTRMDYVAGMHNEAAYCRSVERLLDIEVPRRAQLIRILLMELNRIGSHYVALATGGMELGAVTAMTIGFRDREEVQHLIEHITGLRMNNAFIRPGGVASDLPDDWQTRVKEVVKTLHERVAEMDTLLTQNPIWKQRLVGVGYLPLDGAMSLGVTGPVLRSAGLAWDLRKTEPYWGYDELEFDVPTRTEADAYARYLLRLEEMRQSLRIIEQVVERLEPGPVMVEDAKIAWPAKLSIGSDGLGNSLEHVRKIMGQSMESLIHHFKLVTEGFKVPPGQAYAPIESARGELGCHVVSDGGTRPLRGHMRDPSFVNLQAVPAMVEGSMISDAIVALASVDPVMGGVDR